MSRQGNQKKWYELIELYKNFNGTQKAFCLLHHLKLPTFSYWLRKSAQNNVQASSFIEIKNEGSVTASAFEIYVGPARIEFDRSVRQEDVFDFLMQLKAHA